MKYLPRCVGNACIVSDTCSSRGVMMATFAETLKMSDALAQGSNFNAASWLTAALESSAL